MDGRTPEITVAQARCLFDSIDISHVVGLRDRSILGTLTYTGARVGAIARLRLQDLRDYGQHRTLLFAEKGGQQREIPVRLDLDDWLRAYIDAAGIADDPKDMPLFRAARYRRRELYQTGIAAYTIRFILKRRLKDAGFCVEALEEARTRDGQPEIFNTDQGSQFTGFAFTGRLRAAGVQISMDGRGRCMDNIFIERLWRSLKYEAVYLHDLADGFQARRVIGEWIDFYNAERPHSALGGKTPAEAYRGDPPADMMDKQLRALPAYPPAQQRRQEDRSKEILAR